jgi:DDE superfamily endonuclease
MEINALERLRAFRQHIYTTFGCRRDALVEILDALLTSSVIEHPVHLSLAPGFQRTWGSIYDALNAGSMPLPRLEQLVAAQPLETTTAWYAVDASVWPRCDAETAPPRGSYHHHTRHSNGQPIVAGWNYSWLVQIASTVFQLDRTVARTTDAAGGKRQSGGRRADPLLSASMRG